MDRTPETGRLALTVMIPVILLMILLSACESQNKAVNGTADDAMLRAFAETGAEFERFMLRDVATLDKCSHTVAELRRLTAMLPMALGDAAELTQTEYGDEGYNGISITGMTEQGYALDLVVQSRLSVPETVVILELWQDCQREDYPSPWQYADGCFAAFGLESNPDTVLAGTYQELLSVAAKKQVAKKCFAAINGEITEKAVDGDYVSYSGYAPALGRGKLSGKREINFQAALYDDETAGKTKIFLGFPVIFSDY